MRNSTSLSLASALLFALAGNGILTAARAQSTPVQPKQTPQQSEQSREQDRSRAEDVTIKRDWKAQEDQDKNAGPAAADQDRQTVGRDWRAHPEKGDR